MKKNFITPRWFFLLTLTAILVGTVMKVSAATTTEISKDLFEYIIESDEEGNRYAVILGYGGNKPEVTVPSELEGVPVTKIMPRAFRDNPDIIKLVLPESIESIGEYCFEDLSSLEEITMGGVKKFSDRFGIETEIAPKHLFQYSKKLKRVIFGDGCHFFEEYNSSTAEINMFFNELLDHLEYLYIGNQMPELPERLFCGTSLKEIEVGPENAYYQSIDGALFDKSGKNLMILPTSYEKDTFAIPYGTTGIKGFGMDGCKGLKKIYIPQTMTGLVSKGFNGVSATLYVVQGSDGERFAKEKDFRYQYFGVYLDKTALNLQPGGSAALQVSNETEHTLRWASSNPAAATVDQNGIVTAKAVGTAEITVSDGTEFSVTCTVTVAEKSQTVDPDSGKDDPNHSGSKNPGTENGEEHNADNSSNSTQNENISDKNYSYAVLNGKEAAVTGSPNLKTKQAVIPQTVTISGKQYTVTQIAERAFYKNTKITSVVIPSTIQKIGKQAFGNCKKLKTITVKTTKLTKKSVGAKAWKGICVKAAIKVPRKKLKAYQKLFKSKGAGRKVKYKSL